MKAFSRLIALHGDIDARFDLEWKAALAADDAGAAARAEQKRTLNTLAYFVLFWGQLETEINDACRHLIRARRADGDWHRRRGFDIYNPDDRRLSGLSFESRAALVLDRAERRGGSYSLLVRYYEIRNLVAHGDLETVGIDINRVVHDFYTIQSAITP